MTQHPICCRVDEPLDRVAIRMDNADIGAMPVLDTHDRVIGMVTDRDICMAAAQRGERLDELVVEAAMTRTVHAVAPDDELSEAERIMQHRQVRRVPVLDENGHAVGIVSITDLARFSSSRYRPPVSEHEVAETLRAVTTGRRPLLHSEPPSPRR